MLDLVEPLVALGRGLYHHGQGEGLGSGQGTAPSAPTSSARRSRGPPSAFGGSPPGRRPRLRARLPPSKVPEAVPSCGGRSRPSASFSARMSSASAGRAALVLVLDQEPVRVRLPRIGLHAHEMPLALQLLAGQVELEMSFLVAERGIEVGRPRALVPDHHRAAAVLAFGDDAFEAAIVERMVLGRDGQPLLAGDRLGPSGTAQLFSTPSSSSRKS